MSKNFIEKSITLLAATQCVNALIDIHTNNLAKTQEKSGHTYDWKYGEIYYTITGKGSPILLIHDINYKSSLDEWEDIIKYLSMEHRVYAVDLPGCGLSEKPMIDYTAYFYVQFINDFIKEVIIEKPIVITSKDAAVAAVLTGLIKEDIFEKMVLINPPTLNEHLPQEDVFRHAYRRLMYVPILGKAIYNLENIGAMLYLAEVTNMPAKKNMIKRAKSDYLNIFQDFGKGRFLRASKINGMLQTLNRPDLRNSKDIIIVFSEHLPRARKDARYFLKNAKDVELVGIESKSEYPHRDNPSKAIAALKKVL